MGVLLGLRRLVGGRVVLSGSSRALLSSVMRSGVYLVVTHAIRIVGIQIVTYDCAL